MGGLQNKAETEWKIYGGKTQRDIKDGATAAASKSFAFGKGAT